VYRARNRAIIESYGTRQDASRTPMEANLLATTNTFAEGGPWAPQSKFEDLTTLLHYSSNLGFLDHGLMDYDLAAGYSPASTNPSQPATAVASGEWDAEESKRVEEEVARMGGLPMYDHGFVGDLTAAGSSTSTPWGLTTYGAPPQREAAEESESLEATDEGVVGSGAAEEAEDGEG
jgi:hypothetical protein